MDIRSDCLSCPTVLFEKGIEAQVEDNKEARDELLKESTEKKSSPSTVVTLSDEAKASAAGDATTKRNIEPLVYSKNGTI